MGASRSSKSGDKKKKDKRKVDDLAGPGSVADKLRKQRIRKKSRLDKIMRNM